MKSLPFAKPYLTLFQFIFIYLFSFPSLCQILISSNPADTINKSAQLEVKSSERGFLPPVMSSVMRKGISNPAQGLMVYDSTRQKMYVFTKEGWKPLLFGIDSSNYSTPDKPIVPDLSTGDNLGVSTAMGKEYAVAGAYGDDINGKVDQGSVYIYKKQEGKWQFYAKITAADGMAGDYFGGSMAIADDFIFVGAIMNNSLENNDEGAVYVYKIVDGTIQFHQKIRGIGASQSDGFGYSIAAEGKNLVVGVPFDDIGGNANQGAVYFFTLSESDQWIQYQKYFLPSGQANDQFGHGLSLDSNQLSVGNEIVTSGNYGYSQNAVNILTRIEGVWVHQAKITQPDGLDNREAFSYATNLKGDILTVGAWLHDVPSGNKDRGAVYVYKRTSGTWQFIQKIVPQDVSPGSPGNTYGDYFGVSMARDKNNLLIGASWEDFSPSVNDRGVVYLYEWVGNEFILKRDFRVTNAQNQEIFGFSVEILEDDIMIGAIGRDSFSGTVYFIGKD